MVAEITELGEAKVLKRGANNKHRGAKFGPFLINVVAKITNLWVENSRKINCHDVMSIQEGRVPSSLSEENKFDLKSCNF